MSEWVIPDHADALYVVNAEHWRDEAIAHAAKLSERDETMTPTFEVWWPNASLVPLDPEKGPELFDPSLQGQFFDAVRVDLGLFPNDPQLIVTLPPYAMIEAGLI